MFQIRAAGRVVPTHVRWSQQFVGQLQVSQRHDPETSRALCVARLLSPADEDMLAPLMDASLITVKRGWWTMTGWQREVDDLGRSAAFQQSWILIPVDER